MPGSTTDSSTDGQESPSTAPWPRNQSGGSAARLYRSRSDRILGGVCGGLGPYFDVDPVLIRLVFVLLALGGVGVLAYLILWLIIPARPIGLTEPAVTGRTGSGPAKEILAWALVAIGLILLGTNLHLIPSLGREWFWPLLLVIAGLALLMRRSDPSA